VLRSFLCRPNVAVAEKICRSQKPEQRWIERRDAWLAEDDGDFKDLPQRLEDLSL
jgi:hypothetical protein